MNTIIYFLYIMTEVQANIYFGTIFFIMLAFGVKLLWDYMEQKKLDQYSVTDLYIKDVADLQKLINQKSV